MDSQKKYFANEVYNQVEHICSFMVDGMSSGIPQVLNISKDDTKEMIEKVMVSLPDHYFFNAPPTVLDDMLGLISNDLILFQVKENIEEKANEDDYDYRFTDFISGLSSTIADRYYQ